MTIPQQQSQQLQANRQPPAQLDYQAVAKAQAYFDIRDRNLSLRFNPVAPLPNELLESRGLPPNPALRTSHVASSSPGADGVSQRPRLLL